MIAKLTQLQNDIDNTSNKTEMEKEQMIIMIQKAKKLRNQMVNESEKKSEKLDKTHELLNK